MKLNELPPETLQWMVNKIIDDLLNITSYIDIARQHNLDEVVKKNIAEKEKLREDLTELYAQVIQAMGDIEVQKQIMSN
jgi:hypothetical protein